MERKEDIHLPVELAEHIFINLDGRDVIRCQLACRLFLDLIRSSASLRYKIECFAAGICDGTGRTTSTETRLGQLKEWCSGWRKADWSHSRRLLQSTGLRELLSEDTFFRVTRTRDAVSFDQLSSPLQGIEARQWVSKPLDDQTPGVHYDHAQDLLIVPLLASAHVISVSLLTSDGTPHPDTCTPFFRAYSPEPITHFTTLSLSSLFAIISPGAYMWIWDWRSGTLLLELDAVVSRSLWDRGFAILDDKHLVLPGHYDAESSGTLAFLDCYANPGKVYRSLSDILKDAVLLLQLPSIAKNMTLINVGLSTTGYSPERDAKSAHRSKAVFYPNAESSIVSIELWIRQQDETRIRFTPLIASLPAILSLASPRRVNSSTGLPQQLAWESWAQYTRFLPPDVIALPNIAVCRSRFAARWRREVPKENRFETVVVLLEFDSAASIRRDMASGDTEKMQSIINEPTQANTELLETTLETPLPYRKIVTDIIAPDDYRINLGEHSIVLTPWGDTDKTEIYYYPI